MSFCDDGYVYSARCPELLALTVDELPILTGWSVFVKCNLDHKPVKPASRGCKAVNPSPFCILTGDRELYRMAEPANFTAFSPLEVDALETVATLPGVDRLARYAEIKARAPGHRLTPARALDGRRPVRPRPGRVWVILGAATVGFDWHGWAPESGRPCLAQLAARLAFVPGAFVADAAARRADPGLWRAWCEYPPPPGAVGREVAS